MEIEKALETHMALEACVSNPSISLSKKTGALSVQAKTRYVRAVHISGSEIHHEKYFVCDLTLALHKITS